LTQTLLRGEEKTQELRNGKFSFIQSSDEMLLPRCRSAVGGDDKMLSALLVRFIIFVYSNRFLMVL